MVSILFNQRMKHPFIGDDYFMIIVETLERHAFHYVPIALHGHRDRTYWTALGRPKQQDEPPPGVLFYQLLALVRYGTTITTPDIT